MDSLMIPVKGMNMNALTKALKGVEGVYGVDIDLWQNQATVTYDETVASATALKRIVKNVCHDGD